MARLFEYQGKERLKKAKVPIPQGEVATTSSEARKIAERVGKPIAIKSQIWAGGRGKGGVDIDLASYRDRQGCNKRLSLGYI